MTQTVLDLGDISPPLLLFGGPYSNAHAFDALVEEAQRRGIGPESMICTGDICAYAARPQECVDKARTLGCAVVAGNCEQSLGHRLDDCGCGFADGAACDLLAGQWYAHADAQVSEESRAWMRGLPSRAVLTCAGRRYAVIHGGAEAVNAFIWPTDAVAVKAREIAALTRDLGPLDGVICGHSGVAFVEDIDGVSWINAGAIGLPGHDGDPRTSFATLEADGAHLHRLSYDHKGAAAAMRAVGLTAGYERSLECGWWPSEDSFPEALRRGVTSLTCPGPSQEGDA